jgi:hypothetical protein
MEYNMLRITGGRRRGGGESRELMRERIES